MIVRRYITYALAAVVAMMIVLLASSNLHAQTVDELGICNGQTTTVCNVDQNVGGVQIGTTSNSLPSFQVDRNPNSNDSKWTSTQITVVVLVPNNVASNANLSFTVNATAGVTGTTSGTVNGALANAWNSGTLTSFLGLNTCNGGQGCFGPNNPLSAFLPATQTLTPTATGYFVYTVTLGSVDFSSGDPSFSLTGNNGLTGLPAGSVIYAYVSGGVTGLNGTYLLDDVAPSTSLLINTPPVPEPASMLLFGSGLVFVGGALKKRWNKVQ